MLVLRIVFWIVAFTASVWLLWWSHRFVNDPATDLAAIPRYLLTFAPVILILLTFHRSISLLMSLGAQGFSPPARGTRKVYRPAPGLRWTLLALCAFPLFGIPYALVRDGFPPEDLAYGVPTCLFFVWGALYIARLRTVLDDTTLTTLSGSLRFRSFALDGLTGISIGGWTGDLLLCFDDGRRARISSSLDGFREIILHFETQLARRRR